MPETGAEVSSLEQTAGEIVAFLKNFYVTVQAEETLRSFVEIEEELRGLLLSRPDDLGLSARWIEGLLANSSRTANGVNLVIDVAAAPDLMKTVFTMLVNKASLGSENRTFGTFSPVHRNQLDATRADAMRSLVERSFSSPITALEVGTWFGVGSTQLWLASFPQGSSLFLLDSWRSYVTPEDKASDTSVSFRLMDLLPQAALNSTAREIFKAEASNTRDIDIVMMRGVSSTVLGFLRPDTFDFIYIDGSHYYQDVKTDIVRAKELSKRRFSIVCGDDLETFDPALAEIARQHPDRDYIVANGVGFHPGVTRAVSEEFGRVNLINGFWWIYCREGIWGL